MKKKIFSIIQIGDKSNIPSRVFDLFLSFVIIINILVTFLETFESLSPLKGLFLFVEYFTVCFFVVEYILRLWTADFLYPDTKKKSYIKFIFSYEGIISLLSILTVFLINGFIILRMLRVVRILRLFRVNSQSDSFNIIVLVLKNCKNQLISSIFMILMLILMSSLFMYSAEHIAQPDIFKNGWSAIWWSVSTILTIGYGDIYPVTILGKTIAVIIGFLGVGLIAIPTGIISASFMTHYMNTLNEDKTFTDVTDINEVLLTRGHEFVSKNSITLLKEYGLQVLLVVRDNMHIIPSNDIYFRKGDILVLKSKKKNIVKNT